MDIIGIWMCPTKMAIFTWQMRWSWGGAPLEATLQGDSMMDPWNSNHYGDFPTAGTFILSVNTSAVMDQFYPILLVEIASWTQIPYQPAIKSCCTCIDCGCATVLLYSWYLKGPTRGNQKKHVPSLQWWTPIGNTGGMDRTGSVHISVTEAGGVHCPQVSPFLETGNGNITFINTSIESIANFSGSKVDPWWLKDYPDPSYKVDMM